MTKQRTKIRAFAAFSPVTGINPYWIRSQAGEIRGEPGSSINNVWERAVKRGNRIVRVTVSLEKPKAKK